MPKEPSEESNMLRSTSPFSEFVNAAIGHQDRKELILPDEDHFSNHENSNKVTSFFAA